MTDEVVVPEQEAAEQSVVEGVKEQETEVVPDSGHDFRKGYESIAEPDKEPTVSDPTAEVPIPPKQFTEEEARSLVSQLLASSEGDLRKQLRDVNGKVGSLFQRIDKVATAQPAAAKLTPGGLKRLSAEYPELGAALAEDLAEWFAPPTERKEVAVQPTAPQYLDTLTELHPDWQALRDTRPDDYVQWLEALKPSARFRFEHSTDPLHVAEKLDEFKEWRASRAEPTTAQANARAEESQTRLANAVQPTNGTRQPIRKSEPTPTEAFRSGYDRIAKARL